MGAFNAVKATGTILRITWKETKGFLPLSFDRFIFICSDIITSNTVPCSARILQAN